MKIERFEYFVAVAECGNVTAAARKCFISQTAMSQQMDALEQDLGVRLLNRTKTGTTLTDAGKALLPKAKKLLSDYRDILRSVSPDAERRGRLTIAYTGPLEERLLLAAIPQFRKSYDTVEIQLRQLQMSEIKDALEKGQCDIALTIPGEAELEGFTHISLLEKPICAAVSSQSPLASAGEITIDMLDGYSCVILRQEASAKATDTISKWLLSLGWSKDRILYADTIDNQLLMVKLNQGITFLPDGDYGPGIRIAPISFSVNAHSTEAVLKKGDPLCMSLLKVLKKAAESI